MHIDTSADYNEGNDERMFGEVFRGRPRDSYVCSSGFDVKGKITDIARIKDVPTEFLGG